jgi:hypothetical protein
VPLRALSASAQVFRDPDNIQLELFFDPSLIASP